MSRTGFINLAIMVSALVVVVFHLQDGFGQGGQSAPMGSSNTPNKADSTNDFPIKQLRDNVGESPTKLADLEAELVTIEKRKRGLSGRLQAIAQDEAIGSEDRWNSIFLLGRLGDDTSLDFLTKHISESIAGRRMNTSERQSKALTYHYALRAIAGWKAVPSVLRSLQQERSREDLVWSRNVLKVTLGREAANALLKDELARATHELHRKNLQQMLDFDSGM